MTIARRPSRAPRRLLLALGLSAVAALAATPASARNDPHATFRFATFNASLNRNAPGRALADLSAPGNAQAAAVAEIIQRTRPDVLLINEFDYVPGGALAEAFQDNYLSVSQHGAAPIEYPYWFVAPSNTGIHSGMDFDNNGVVNPTPNVPAGTNPTYGNDSYGYGEFPGQYGMAVASRYPIDDEAVRTFQHFLWKDMPGARLPDDPATAAPDDWYSAQELAVFRLSSKSHWDVPIDVAGSRVHFLVSHPTPPVFDGAEDRNGTRNSDEIRFWADYVLPSRSAYIYDDDGVRGGLTPGARFVIAGDQNSDPLDGDSIPGSIQQLLNHPLVNARTTPSSLGGPWASRIQDALNDVHRSDPAFDTADFCDTPAFPPCSGPGNLRADYVLPRKNLTIVAAGVFWPSADPADGDPLAPFAYLTDPTGAGFPAPSSDHRLVWIDLRLPG